MEACDSSMKELSSNLNHALEHFSKSLSLSNYNLKPDFQKMLLIQPRNLYEWYMTSCINQMQPKWGWQITGTSAKYNLLDNHDPDYSGGKIICTLFTGNDFRVQSQRSNYSNHDKKKKKNPTPIRNSADKFGKIDEFPVNINLYRKLSSELWKQKQLLLNHKFYQSTCLILYEQCLEVRNITPYTIVSRIVQCTRIHIHQTAHTAVCRIVSVGGVICTYR